MTARIAIRSLACGTIGLLSVGWLTGQSHAQGRPTRPSIQLTLPTPEPVSFDLALDELELDFTEAGPAGKTAAQAPVAVASTVVARRAGAVATFSVTGVAGGVELAHVSQGLAAANPGSEMNFVLYLAGTERGEATRRVLTTHVALILADPTDPTGVLEEYKARERREQEGVPGAYVLEAADPWAAVDLAEALRNRAGVETAYPLLKQRQFVR